MPNSNITKKQKNKSEQGEINKTVLRTYSQIRVKLSFYLFRCLIPVSIRKKYLPLNLDTYKKWENIYKKKKKKFLNVFVETTQEMAKK